MQANRFSWHAWIAPGLLVTAMTAAGCSAAAATATVTGTVVRGPICPVVREGGACDDMPASGTVRALDGDQREVASTTTDGNGDFVLAVPPGSYLVTAEVEGAMSCPQIEVVAVDDRPAVAMVNCDTGIR